MADALNDARQLIEARLREVRDELVRLERVLGDLGGGAPARGRRRARRTRPARRRTGTREERMNSLVAEARKTPAASNAELAKALGVTPSYVSQLLAEGRKTGRVARRNGKLAVGGTRRGNKTGTKPRKSPTARRRQPAGIARKPRPPRRQASTTAGPSRAELSIDRGSVSGLPQRVATRGPNSG
jgi:hypothetical protein